LLWEGTYLGEWMYLRPHFVGMLRLATVGWTVIVIIVISVAVDRTAPSRFSVPLLHCCCCCPVDVTHDRA
jgi:hypothetical protein